MSERIGIFGGSFDPVHHGHLVLAQDALEFLALDRLIFVPAAINPHKLDTAPRASATARLTLLESAIAGEERFSVDPLELGRSGPSFTIETVETFRMRWPEAQLFLLLGEDNRPKLHTWHRFEELQTLVTFVFFGRGSAPEPPAAGRTAISSANATNTCAGSAGKPAALFLERQASSQTRAVCETPSQPHRFEQLPRRVDISSTEIRQRIAQGLSIRYLVPESVRLLIQSHALYPSPDQPAAGPPVFRGGPR
jgi:nicotinate-nucleotide adenylyltransferase